MILRSFVVTVLGDIASWLVKTTITLDHRWGTDIWEGSQ